MAGVNVGVRVAEILRGLQTARSGGGLAREATMGGRINRPATRTTSVKRFSRRTRWHNKHC